MPNSKRRCRGCKEYKPVNGFYRPGFCSKECLDRFRRSAPAPKSKSSSPTSPSYWDRQRRAIRERDHGRCRVCRTTADLHVHHITYRSQISVADGRDHETNLITLCNEHHAIVHMNPSRYQPLLRGVIWMLYVHGTSMTVHQLERWLSTGVVD